ncbi:MAG TPA: EamA family transporter, partial [Actinomycetota bacterium]|nr:EamA family transporter [Actinomycetota bacterium]
MVSESRIDRVTGAAFVGMVAGIAGNVVAVKYVARAGDQDPMWAAASRFALATAIFLVIAIAVRAAFPVGRALAGALLYGSLTFGGFFVFAYLGLQRAPVGIASVVLATGPLLTFAFALAHRQERFRWDSLIGGAAAVAGTALVFVSGLDQGVPGWSLLAILAASACAAEGTVIVKAFPPMHPVMRNAIGTGVGTAILALMIPLFGESIAVPSEPQTWVAQAYLITFGTVGVFGLYLFLLSRWTASAVSYEFVLAPLA